MSKTTVGLLQINASFSGASYLPYSVGLLEAHARKSLPDIDDFEFLPPVFRRDQVDTIVETLLPADIVAASLYVWNNQLSLTVLEKLKAIKPGIVTVVGGPHVPDRYKSHVQNKQIAVAFGHERRRGDGTIDPSLERTQAYLREHRYIDIAVHGEGERPFALLLEHLSGRWEKVPSISYLDEAGFIVQTERMPRLKDLNDIASPYLDGTFDALIASHPDVKWLTVWETNRGCPFSCAFCDWGSAIASKISRGGLERAYEEIEWIAAHEVEFVFLTDANFGILPRDIDIARYCADLKKRTGYPHTITVSNTKNATDRSYQVQKIFAEAGLAAGASLSMQSLDPQTLKDIKRDNISLDSYREIQRRMKKDGVSAFTDIILGLPGETYDSFANGIDQLIRSGLHDRVLFYNLAVLPNAEMADPSYRAAHGMKTVECRSINIHGAREEIEGDVPEKHEVVIATRAMPEDDWVRTCVFRWSSAFLHFDKIFQVPLVVTHALTGAGYRELIELFSDGRFGRSDEFPTLDRIRQFFIAKARAIQRGEEEFCYAPDWLGIWWPADEYMLIDLATGGRLASFYREARGALEAVLVKYGAAEHVNAVREAAALNQVLLKLPFRSGLASVRCSYNVWEFYQAAVGGEPIALERRESTVTVDHEIERWQSWDDWCRHVVWYGSKRSAYLYGHRALVQIAGHF